MPTACGQRVPEQALQVSTDKIRREHPDVRFGVAGSKAGRQALQTPALPGL